MTDSEKIEYLMAAVNELLRRVGGVAPQAPAGSSMQEYWPSSIPGQRIPKVTGNLSIDFVAAMLGHHNMQPTPERDANLAEEERIRNAHIYVGKYAADAIANDIPAAVFVYVYSTSQPGLALASKVYRESGLFAGPFDAIARLIQAGELNSHGGDKTDAQIIAEYPDGEFKRDVMAVTV